MPLESRNDAGFRQEGRSFWPANRLEPLPPAKGATKLVERDVLTDAVEEQFTARIGFLVGEETGDAKIGLLSAKLEATVATSIAEEL